MWTGARRGIVAVLALAAVSVPALAQDIPAQPIPENPQERAAVTEFEGVPATPNPVKSFRIPQHKYMARNGTSNIHNDAYMTDSYKWAGPLGIEPVSSSTAHFADCASLTFDAGGRIVSICVGADHPRLVMMDPETLATKAMLDLPPRTPTGTGTTPFNDFAGGGYFYLDHKDRAIIPTSTREIWTVTIARESQRFSFIHTNTYDLTQHVQPDEAIVSALPDWKSYIWFVTTGGLVGTVDQRDGEVHSLRLEDEVIANSFAVDETGGVFVASDHALYRFDREPDGQPFITWRKEYDRGNRVKPGQVTQGSGTTPTLIKKRFVAITDNADPYMHVVVYKRKARSKGRKVCQEPVFDPDAGATDNSLVAVGRSLIVENNYGYAGPTSVMDGATTTPGLARVVFSKRKGCSTAWESGEVAPSVVPKASLESGLLYTYTKPPRDDQVDAWYLTAIDIRTGVTVYSQLAGTGLGFNNNYAPVSLGPDGSAYVGVLGGLVRIADSP